MIKVIIVDDEPRICKLIANLAPWDELGMEVVGIAHNGVDALKLIQSQDPQIVVTDVRMPGLDGLELIEQATQDNPDLEFILISGYEEFAYAQRAMSFGVKDYLSKPINRDNLSLALTRAREAVQARERQRALEDEYANIHKDEAKIRASFLRDLILLGPDELLATEMEAVNQSYYFHFHEGAFRIIIIQIDPMQPTKAKGIGAQQGAVLASSLQSAAYEVEIAELNGNFYVLVNYDPKIGSTIKALLQKNLMEFKTSLSPLGFMVTFGCGAEVPSLSELQLSLDTAKAAVNERILQGAGQIIVQDEHTPRSITDDERFLKLYKKLTKAIELLHVDMVSKAIRDLKAELLKGLSEDSWLSGSALKSLVREIVNTYYIILRTNNVRLEDGEAERAAWEEALDHAYSLDLLFAELIKGITASLTRIAEGETKRHAEKIALAKRYVEEHYMENITLEDLGEYLGFNPSYFSTLFKKETGTSFVEYLSRVRMEKAKELLKETDLKIQDICLMVGYNDVRYFRKLFARSTGLSPNEYRRIFA
ncbi:MAG TPA: response regulator [Firmicutes bacterium]|nr:response regulator [Bacillota bacterium]